MSHFQVAYEMFTKNFQKKIPSDANTANVIKKSDLPLSEINIKERSIILGFLLGLSICVLYKEKSHLFKKYHLIESSKANEYSALILI